jgi:thiamine kinase-like enzyme
MSDLEPTMTGDPLAAVPTAHREPARAALAAMGAGPIRAIAPVTGGASGAAIFRVEAGGRRYLLRVEGPASPLLRRNPHRHLCLDLAARAGIAPPVHHIDEASGVTVSDFIEQRPLASYPGGAPALAKALGAMLARLQSAAPAFPQLVDYRDLVAGMLDHVRKAGAFAPGLLDPHAERMERLRAACDWDPGDLVSNHNDLNPGNILFDGQRLWLIDWESAYRNDPLVDVAIVLDGFAPTPGLEDVLLEAWLSRAPDEAIRARLAMVRAVARLYYACILFTSASRAPRAAPDADLAAPSPRAFRQAVRDGRLAPFAPRTAHILGKIFLSAFMTGLPAPGLGDAMAAAVGQG